MKFSKFVVVLVILMNVVFTSAAGESVDKSYNLIYDDDSALSFWQERKKDFFVLGVDYNRLLKDTRIYLGVTPSNRFSGRFVRGWYNPAKDKIVSRQLRKYVVYHEIGHHIHFTWLRDGAQEDMEKWEEWAALTGHELDLEVRLQEEGRWKGFRTAMSWEHFADDFAYLMTQRSMRNYQERRRFYLSLWQEVGSVIVLEIDSPVIRVNGEPVRMDVAPFIKDGRTFIPLRFVSEALGAGVDYEPKDGRVEKVYVYR